MISEEYYWVIDEGVDGARKVKITEEEASQYGDDDMVGFYTKRDQEKYYDLCWELSSYYTGDPGQEYGDINRLIKQKSDFLKKTEHIVVI